MNNDMDFGLDEMEQDLFEENKTKDSDKVLKLEERKKRRPWHEWTINGREYRLVLTTQAIMKVEAKYRTNIVNLVAANGIPQLSVMLTIIQAAMLKHQHGMKSNKVIELYEQYVSEGGSQVALLNEVIMPTMTVSGFFTEDQSEVMTANMEGMDALI